jgi:hypothetical protein
MRDRVSEVGPKASPTLSAFEDEEGQGFGSSSLRTGVDVHLSLIGYDSHPIDLDQERSPVPRFPLSLVPQSTNDRFPRDRDFSTEHVERSQDDVVEFRDVRGSVVWFECFDTLVSSKFVSFQSGRGSLEKRGARLAS